MHKQVFVTRRDPMAREGAKSEHLVQLFDEFESLADGVANFLFSGWSDGAPLMVVARPTHWAGIAGSLAAHACPLDDLERSERVVVLDAAALLGEFVQNGRPVRERFFASVGAAMGELSHRFETPPCIYGEMVDILAARGEFTCAHQLEQLWNELGDEYPMKLLCGYASGHFGDSRSASILGDICAAHHAATAPPGDLLGGWLLSRVGNRLHTTA